MEDRLAIAAKIRALQNMSLERGFTEAEAMLAANKIAELMLKYRISMSDIEIQSERVGRITIDLFRKNRHPINLCLKAIADYTGTKSWLARGHSVRVVFFGLERDVMIAKYLLTICRNAIDTESVTFKTSPLYVHSKNRKGDFISFGNGMASAMAKTLRSMIPKAPVATASGTSLVVIKNAIVETAYAKLALSLKAVTSPVLQRSSATEHGRLIGSQVQFNSGVTAGKTDLLA